MLGMIRTTLLAALALLLASGCEWDYLDQFDHAPRSDQWLAAGALRDRVIAAGHDDPGGGGLGVYWSDEVCPTDEQGRTAIVHRGVHGRVGCVAGRYYGCGSMLVAWRGDVWASAYEHELLHCYRDRLYDDPDAYHEHREWWALDEAGMPDFGCEVED